MLRRLPSRQSRLRRCGTIVIAPLDTTRTSPHVPADGKQSLRLRRRASPPLPTLSFLRHHDKGGNVRSALCSVPALVLLAGCVHMPPGPSVAVMPAPGKPFDLFVSEERLCQQYANEQVGISPQKEAQTSLVESAAVGTAIGAAAGTALGAAAGDVGGGAVFGAGAGLMAGSALGSNAAYANSWSLQQRYDVAYEQCMYAKGNQLPGFPRTAPPPPVHPPPF